MYGRSDDEWDSLIEKTIPILERLAANKELSNYTELNRDLADTKGAVPFDFSLDRDRAAVGALLGAVVDRTHADVGAMLSALVKYINDNDPGAGFYRFAESRGWLLRGADHMEFWAKEVQKLYNFFSVPEYDHYRSR